MNKLDNLKLIKKLDRSDMLKFISGLPGQCRDAYKIGSSVNISKPSIKISNIVFAGVGGSSIGAGLVKVYLHDELKIPVSICRNYALPDFTREDTILFCSSYSGNTEETLSCFENGLKKKAFIITLGSGGRLKEIALKNNITHISIPSGYPPRTAVGYMSIIILAILARLDLIKDKENDVKELCNVLSDIRDKEIGFEVPLVKNISKQIAAKLYKKYPVIYGTADTTEAVAMRWREQIAENAKALSSGNVFPEMNHNEIVGWKFPKNILKDFKAIIFSDKDDYERVKERIKIISGIIKKSGSEVILLKRDSGGRLARIFSLLYIGDFVSFYLAILNNIDPTPVEVIDYLKKELGKI
ncbi:MAG: bifunctional phosphoglucose/phosphomannose isomerase [Candidatus Omnitrophica bacterium CG22_combo_CG10-13_8_21_14_all_43_16]|nr:MAG: bifunctional phosphoglucose/phosphomannose isomerase [Candidatus Omnitrophica bacterium CG22_combo_CG10-13_8_21_14_all_43_16]